MQNETKQDESLSPEVQEIMRNLIAAIRVTKLYPLNNPIYTQTVKKSFESLSNFLQSETEYHVGVQKTHFTSMHSPVGKDAQLNKAIAQDLFAKGIREVIFSSELTEPELLELYQALALSSEELAMRSGISTILWEKGATHIKVTEAGLDEVITTKTDGGWDDTPAADSLSKSLELGTENKRPARLGRTLVLGDVITDPEGFGASMVALAMQTRAKHESVEDRLFTLYQQAGSKIRTAHADESEKMFNGLAQSALSLEQPYRDGLIAGKLYGDLDAEMATEEQGAERDQQLPNAVHEIQTGRFSSAWNAQQVATLLKRASVKKITPSAPPPSPSDLVTAPLPQDLTTIAKELAEYSPEQMEALKALSDCGMESDIIEAAVRNLISLIPLVKNPQHTGSEEREIGLFSGVIHQLEDMLSYLLKKNNYDLATVIIKALHTPVDPEFKPRMAEALKKTATKSIVISTIEDMRKRSKESPEYQSAYAYLSILERKATEALLELLAEENDREKRIFLLDLMKEFGKNQIALLGEQLSDGRWYVVRNIVNILGESKTEQALAFLRKVVDHKNVQIRQEVIKALISIGGKKAAGLLAKYLTDDDVSVQVTAIRALADFPGIGAEEAAPLVEFLQNRPIKKKEQEITLEVIRAIGKIGGHDAGEFLKGYTRIRWWKPRKLQTELRDASQQAIAEIKERQGDGGRAKR